MVRWERKPSQAENAGSIPATRSMNPPPKRVHQHVASRLLHALIPVADEHGPDVLMEAGLFDPSKVSRITASPT